MTTFRSGWQAGRQGHLRLRKPIKAKGFSLAGRDEIKHASRAFSLLLAGGALATTEAHKSRRLLYGLCVCWAYVSELTTLQHTQSPTELRSVGLPFVAERTRFELVIRVFAYDGLANRWFQPLTHLSGTLFRREIVPIRLD